MNNIQELIKERLEKLPPNIARAVQAVPWIERMGAIAIKHKLDLEKTEAFELETAFIVLGVEPFESYPENLANEVGLDEETVVSIASEVDKEIIAPILKSAEEKIVSENEKKEAPVIPMEKPGPVIITQETKKEVIKELSQRVEAAKQSGGASAPEVISKKLPMVEKGEVVHDVPHVESAPSSLKPSEVPVKPTINPDISYSKGKDPYREPLD